MLRDFKCDQCGHTHNDKWVMFKDITLEFDCLHCSKGRMRLQPSAPSFVVKGYAASNGYSKERS